MQIIYLVFLGGSALLSMLQFKKLTDNKEHVKQ